MSDRMFTMKEQCKKEMPIPQMKAIIAFLKRYNPDGQSNLTAQQGKHITHHDIIGDIDLECKDGSRSLVKFAIEHKHDTWPAVNIIGEAWGSISKNEVIKERERKDGTKLPRLFFPSGSTRFSPDGSNTSHWAKNSYDEVHEFLKETLTLDIPYAKLGYAFAKEVDIGDHTIFQYLFRTLQRESRDGRYVPCIPEIVLSRVVKIFNGHMFRDVMLDCFNKKECDLLICPNRNDAKTRFWASINVIAKVDKFKLVLLSDIHLSDDETVSEVDCYKVYKK